MAVSEGSRQKQIPSTWLFQKAPAKSKFLAPAGRACLDEAILIHAEDDGAFEAVMFCEDAGEGGAGFLGAVFVIAGEEDDVLAKTWSGLAFIDDGGGVERAGGKCGG